MNTTPYDFQLDALEALNKFRGRGLLAMEPGLGKSLCSLMFAMENPSLRPVVIVCPATLKWNWANECKKHFSLESQVLETTKVPKKGLKGAEDFLIINYDILHAWVPTLKKLNPQLIISDESHYLKSRKTRRSREFRKLVKDVKSLLMLTGTPMVNRPSELYNLLNLLRPDLYPSFFQFAMRFCSPVMKGPFGWDFSGCSDLVGLHSQMSKKLMFRIRKQDVLKDLPDKVRHIIPLELSKRGEYDKASKDYLSWVRQNKAEILQGALRAESLSKGSQLRQLVAKLKLPAVCNWIDDFLESSEEKLVVFGHHVEILEGLHGKYKDNSVLVNGSVTGKKRQKAIDSFVGDSSCKLFFGNIQAAGTGWSATGCPNVAFIELDWTPAAHTQCEDRTHGINRGVEGVVTQIWYLIGRNTLEEKFLEILQRKQLNSDKVLDGKPVQGSLNVHDLLMEGMLEDRE